MSVLINIGARSLDAAAAATAAAACLPAARPRQRCARASIAAVGGRDRMLVPMAPQANCLVYLSSDQLEATSWVEWSRGRWIGFEGRARETQSSGSAEATQQTQTFSVLPPSPSTI